MADELETPKRVPKARVVFTDLSGAPLDTSKINKFFRDVITYAHGSKLVEGVVDAKGKVAKLATVTKYDPASPLGGVVLSPGEESPVCKKCGLNSNGARNPYIAYAGPKNPLVTVVYEGVSRPEDEHGTLSLHGSISVVRRIIEEAALSTGVNVSQIRWLPITRCASWEQKPVNYKVKGNWCRLHAVQDLMRFPPKLVLPVGTAVLGLLSHKSNAQDWGGRLLTWRGWPDDWLTQPEFVLPRPDPADPDKTVIGHPLFGGIPSTRLPMLPIQTPRLVFAARNPYLYTRWKASIEDAMVMAKEGIAANVYLRPWYRFTEDVEVIEQALNEIVRNPGMLLCYDTETTGLRPWAPGAAIVSMMFRWRDAETGNPRTIGFPWDFDGSGVRPFMGRLKPLIWRALCGSRLVGHNITFDVLYTFACLWRDDLSGWDDPARNIARDKHLCDLADAAVYDTWHIAYTHKQQRGTLGLEAITYDHAPKLAGYEEDMTLLIELHSETMDPAAGKGGHYLNCPRDKWKSHLIPYVMGDVEACYTAFGSLRAKLAKSRVYEFPLAKPDSPEKFRWFTPPSREWVYDNIMSPSARVLMKMMGRGMFISMVELEELEKLMPKKIKSLRDELPKVDQRIGDWCRAHENEAKAKGEAWFLDLENKSQLKEILFKVLGLKIQRLTKNGKKMLGESPEDLEKVSEDVLFEYAATDKFTLNKLAVDYPHIRPLQDYRKVYKLYSTYVRPLQNIQTEGIDKKARTKDRHLSEIDTCIHASFMLTGTRGGRLSCRDPNLQQFPRTGEIKSMYVSRFGQRGCLYQGDLSQIELRLMASACGDPTMVKAYFDGTDLHSLTASHIFKAPYEHYTKDYMKFLQSKDRSAEAKQLDQNRNIAKTVNFLTGYGGGAFGLQNVLAAQAIYLSLEDCEAIIESFFDSYPSLRKLLSYYKRFIMDNGVAVSIFGRVRIFEEVFGEDQEAISKAQRAGCNHLIQSTASDMMLVALFVIEQMMREQGLESILVSTVHDSLLIDCIQLELPKVHDIVSSVLDNFSVVLPAVFGDDYDTSWMLVPFSGDYEVGLDYLNTKKIPKTDIDWEGLLHVDEAAKR
jgi:DNA polymerase I-like protein with 3'-5' exonuclease and polymerase domains